MSIPPPRVGAGEAPREGDDLKRRAESDRSTEKRASPRSTAASHGRLERLARGAERRLTESEESQLALFRNAPVPMHALDTKHRILDVNEAWLHALGYSRDEVIGRSITDFHATDTAAAYEVRWQRVLATGKLNDADRQYRMKSGQVMDAVVSAIAERNAAGAIVRVISVVTDVTARRRAEQSARRERRFSELLVASSTEGIIAVDPELRYSLWNPHMETLSGIPRDAIVGRTLLEMFPHLRGTAVEEAWRGALAGRRSAVSDWAYFYPQTGRTGFHDQQFAPLYDAEQSIVGAIAFVHDTTERRRVEDALRQSQKMEAIAQLTGGVAHDMNNLLMVIAGNLDMLREKVPPAAERHLDAIGRAARRGESLTRQLLAFSRRQALQPKTLDLAHRLPKLAALLRPSLRGDIELVVEVPAKVWPVEVDPGEFELALLNIAMNARDAMPRGGRLTVEVENRQVPAGATTGIGKAGDFVAITITDTGVGIPAEVLPRIFEPFYTTKEVGKGTGLGLSQVYGFAKQSGGEVSIDTAVGSGTTVTLLLPRSHQPLPPREASATVATSRRGEGTILLVEDNDEVAKISSALLTQLGYEVVRASTARQALNILGRRNGIALVLTDIIMPGSMSGLDLARAIRRRRPALPVLLTTGYSRRRRRRPRRGSSSCRSPITATRSKAPSAA